MSYSLKSCVCAAKTIELKCSRLVYMWFKKKTEL